MKSDLIGVVVGLVFFLSAGIGLTFFANQAREYYFGMYRKGIENTGILKSWIDKYPGVWFFRTFGILALIASVALVMILIKKLSK